MDAAPRQPNTKGMPLKPVVRPQGVRYAVQASLRNYILENNLPSGASLPPENELARQLGVSRSAVREAIKGLETLGVIEIRHGAGLFVGSFSFEPLLNNLPFSLVSNLKELADLLEIRHALETSLIAPAIQVMTPVQLDRLRQLVDQMRERAERGEMLFEEDPDFHRALFEPLNNHVLLRLLDLFWLAFHKAAEQADILDPNPRRTYLDHAAILTAVAAQDTEQARLALDKHYDGLGGRLKRVRQEREAQLPTLAPPEGR